ncbi:GH25 family lysozyme [Acinetobacter indicus]|uniref:GH25 family lysozyme n=1 Tax=Acinetobacter indicus TaxID=756892 RepID=UPI003BFA26D0
MNFCVFIRAKVSFYNIVLVNQFPQVPLWVREYQGKPALSGNPDWLFWQYSNRGQIPGIATPVDLNAFYGDEQDWQQFLKANQIVEPSKNSVDTTP